MRSNIKFFKGVQKYRGRGIKAITLSELELCFFYSEASLRQTRLACQEPQNFSIVCHHFIGQICPACHVTTQGEASEVSSVFCHHLFWQPGPASPDPPAIINPAWTRGPLNPLFFRGTLFEKTNTKKSVRGLPGVIIIRLKRDAGNA